MKKMSIPKLTLREDAEMSLPELARILADFLAALNLHDVAIVANDTGGAIAQWLAGHRAERVGSLVLTSCDAFDRFPPRPQRYLMLAARVPGALWLIAAAVQFRCVQRLRIAYGWTTYDPIEQEMFTGIANDLPWSVDRVK